MLDWHFILFVIVIIVLAALAYSPIWYLLYQWAKDLNRRQKELDERIKRRKEREKC